MVAAGDTERSGAEYRFAVQSTHPGGLVTFELEIDAGDLSFSDSFQVQVE